MNFKVFSSLFLITGTTYVNLLQNLFFTPNI